MSAVTAPQSITTLPTGLVQDILNYLATRPYQEVFPLIHAVQSTAKIVEDGEGA